MYAFNCTIEETHLAESAIMVVMTMVAFNHIHEQYSLISVGEGKHPEDCMRIHVARLFSHCPDGKGKAAFLEEASRKAVDALKQYIPNLK